MGPHKHSNSDRRMIGRRARAARGRRSMLEMLEERTLFSVVIPAGVDGSGSEPVPAIVKLAASTDHLVYGGALELDATIRTAMPVDASGVGVTFSDLTVNGAVVIGHGVINGSIAAFHWKLPGAGKHSISVSVDANSVIAQASSAPLSITIDPALTTLSVIKSAANIVAQVRGAAPPAGVVAFFDGTRLMGTVPVDAAGRAVMSAGGLSSGSHAVTASFEGTQNLQPSAAQVTLTIPGAPATGQTEEAAAPMGTSALAANLDWLKSFTVGTDSDTDSVRKQKVGLAQVKLLATSNAIKTGGVYVVG